jgi:uncharacterized protein DUF4349
MHRRRVTTTLIAGVLLTGVLLAGCGSDDSGADTTDSTAMSQADTAEAPQAAAGGAPAAKDTTAEAPDLRVDTRSIIYTGSITVRVENVTTAAAQATGIASAAGGFIGADERHSGTGADTANLTLRVPADKFGSVVDQLAKLGTEEVRGLNTEDVTEEVVDLDARISVQKARLESGKKLLSQAKSLDDLVMLEREVASRESDLAALEAKKRRLGDLTALSTITVVLLDPDATRAEDPDDAAPGFLAGLSGGWKALVASLSVLMTLLGVLLPWLLVLGLPAAVVLHLLKRHRRRRAPALVAPADNP